MKKRYVREEIFPFMERILKKKKIRYVYENSRIGTELTSRAYHELVETAMCLEQQEKSKSRIPVKSLNEILKGRVDEPAFCILKKDAKDYLKITK